VLPLWALLPRPPGSSMGSLKLRCMCDVAILQPHSLLFAVDGVVLVGQREKWWWWWCELSVVSVASWAWVTCRSLSKAPIRSLLMNLTSHFDGEEVLAVLGAVN